MRNILFILVFLAGCVTVPPQETTTEKTPPVKTEKKLENQNYAWNGKASHQAWIDATKEGLRLYGKEMLETTPRDYKAFCPGYKGLNREEKIQFYTGLIAAMSKRESNFGPSRTYNEGFKNSRGETVVSTGMLQLSYESARGYGCKARTTTLLKNARLNLHCGVRILNRWIGRDGVISGGKTGAWRGGARYWSVMRNRKNTGSVGARGSSLEYIQKNTKALKVCK